MEGVHSYFFPKEKIYSIPTEFREPEHHLYPGFTPGPTNMSSGKPDFGSQVVKVLTRN